MSEYWNLSGAGTMTTVLKINTDGTVEKMPIKRTDRVRELLDVELVDVIRCGDFDLWVDDEGLINGSESNIVASLLLVSLDIGVVGQMLHGPVLAACVDDEGDTVALTTEIEAMLTSKLRAIHRYAVDQGILGRG